MLRVIRASQLRPFWRRTQDCFFFNVKLAAVVALWPVSRLVSRRKPQSVPSCAMLLLNSNHCMGDQSVGAVFAHSIFDEMPVRFLTVAVKQDGENSVTIGLSLLENGSRTGYFIINHRASGIKRAADTD